MAPTPSRMGHTVESAFLGLFALRGKMIKRLLYAKSLSTLSFFPSSLRFLRRWSTMIPSLKAALGLTPASFNSPRLKPRPWRILLLYRTVCPRTAGRRGSRGRAPRRAALERRARLRRSLRPGWSNQVRTRRCQSFRKWFLWRTNYIGKSRNYQRLYEFRRLRTHRYYARNPSISLKSTMDINE